MLREPNSIQTHIIPPKTPCLGTGLLGTVLITKQVKENVVPVPRQDVPTPVTAQPRTSPAAPSAGNNHPCLVTAACMHTFWPETPTSPPSSTSAEESSALHTHNSPCHCRTHTGRSWR